MRGIALIALLLLLLTSCQREPLELYHDGRAEVDLTYDWISRFGEQPEGMTLMLARNGDSISYYDVTHRVDETTMRLQAGEYRLTVMNKTFGEYGTMRFYNRNSHDGLYAQSNTYYVQSDAFWDNGRTYLQEPEKIGVAIDTFMVPRTVDQLTFYDYRDNSLVDTIRLKRHETVYPMTTTLRVRVMVRGISYMRSMEGYITGMADGFLLNTRWRRREVGTIKLDNWERDYSEEARRKEEGTDLGNNVGFMVCNVETFGLPHGRELLKWRTPESNYINLHFTLIDGRTKDFPYQVGTCIRYEGDDGTLNAFYQADVSLRLDLEIDTKNFGDNGVPIMPYAQPEGSGQFDAQVADWGDDVEVEVPMF